MNITAKPPCRRVVAALALCAGLVLSIGVALSAGLVDGAQADSGPAATYHIANTGGASVNVRSAPSLAADIITMLSAGAQIDISCQTAGDQVSGTAGGTSDIWDQLAGGGYISDLFTDTPAVGAFSPGIPQCAPQGTLPAPAASPPATPQDPGAPFVAMGDSYSSGMGTYDYGYDGYPADGPCRRSPETYSVVYATSYQLPSWLGQVMPKLVACSGAPTSDITGGNAPQISQDGLLGPGTRLVTLTTGGDDNNAFAGILTSCLQNVNPGYDCWADKTNQVYTQISALEPTLVSTYGAIHAQAPNAHIVVLTYPDIFPPAVVNCGQSLGILPWEKMSQTDLDHIHSAWQHMNDVVKQAAGQAGVSVLDEQDAFAGHDICSSAPYANGLNGLNPLANPPADSESFHPNIAGYQKMADDLAIYIDTTWP